MRRKMYATAMTAMLVTGTLMGLAVPESSGAGQRTYTQTCR